MHILIDARLIGLEHAGLGRYVQNLVKHLHLIDTKNTYSILVKSKYKNIKLADNWKAVVFDVNHYTIKEQIYLPLIIKKINPDLVHFPHFNTPLFTNKNFVVTIHDMIMHKSKGKKTTTQNTLSYLLKRAGYKTIFRNSVKKANAVIVPSNYVKKEVSTYFGLPKNKIFSIYEGIDESFLNSKWSEDVLDKYLIKGNYLIYVGNAYPHKNLDCAIKAIKIFNQESKKRLKLVIITSKSVFKQRLGQRIQNLQAQNEVKLLGFVPDNDLASLMHYSKAYVYPSLREGFGLQGLEAIASQTMLLASDIEVFNEIYKDNAFYFDPLKEQTLVNLLHNVVNLTEKERENITKRSKLLLNEYSWDNMAKSTIKVYEGSVSL